MLKALTISPEINLLGKTVDEALPTLDKYLDDAYLSHLSSVRVVHGLGAHNAALDKEGSFGVGEGADGSFQAHGDNPHSVAFSEFLGVQSFCLGFGGRSAHGEAAVLLVDFVPDFLAFFLQIPNVIPGKSNAFAISSKLGLSDDIIAAAKEQIGKEEKSFEDVIADLEQSRVTIEKEGVCRWAAGSPR